MPEELIIKIIGKYGWLILTFLLSLLFRNTLENIFFGLIFWFDKTFNPDDLVYLDGRKARIIRIGFRKTVFFMYDKHTFLHIYNERIRFITLEKMNLKQDAYDLGKNDKNII